MPIVGIASRLLTSAARRAGMDSSTIPNTPVCSRSSASSSRRRAVSAVRPCGRIPPNLWTDCGVRPRCPSTGIPASSTAWIAGSISRPPSIKHVLASARTGEEATIRGWIYRTRSSGAIVFAVVRDSSGIIQVTAKKGNLPDGDLEAAKSAAIESSVIVTGKVFIYPNATMPSESPTRIASIPARSNARATG